MKKYALIGNPLGHSMSKIIHELLFQIKSSDSTYELFESENLNKMVQDKLVHLDGFNVTIPYKKEIIEYLDEATEKVKLYHACNTVVQENNKMKGYNTDVFGFLNSLKKHNINLQGKKVLVTGAGGVSSMMACEAVLSGAKVFVYARNEEKKKAFIEEIKIKTGVLIQSVSIEEIKEFDILLQGTPAGMYPNFLASSLPFRDTKEIPFVFDTIYNPQKTLLLKVSEYFSNSAVGGLEMLVYQAAKAQELFENHEFQTEELELVTKKVQEMIKPLHFSKNIILIGPPASGKSTIGSELAMLLGGRFIDIDREIENKEQKTVAEIFETKGESYFRELETKALEESLLSTGNVISTGGGIVEYNDLSKIERKENIVVFIDVNYSVLVNRLRNDETRPLLKGNLDENLHIMIRKRYPLYYKYSDVKIKISTERDKKENVVDILDKLLIS